MERQSAPDGGPVSTYKAPNPMMRPTKRVRLRQVAGTPFALIAVSDFDPELHEDAPERTRRKQIFEEPVSEDPTIAARAELLTYSMDRLREMSELTGREVSADRTKPELVELILSIRADPEAQGTQDAGGSSDDAGAPPTGSSASEEGGGIGGGSDAPATAGSAGPANPTS